MNNKQIKKILAVFFCIDMGLLAVYGYLFFVVNAKNKETTILYTASHEQTSDKEKIQALFRVLRDTEEDREKLSKYFITKMGAVTFIEQIEKIGKNAGVQLSVNTVSDEESGGGAIQISFGANGSFAHMQHLIALVESMPYKVTIKKADIQKIDEQKDGQAVWKGTFNVVLESFSTDTVALSAAAANARVGER